jgi:hypothetical protein
VNEGVNIPPRGARGEVKNVPLASVNYFFPRFREISDELYAVGGRLGLAELSQLLTVDFSHVEAQVKDFFRRLGLETHRGATL